MMRFVLVTFGTGGDVYPYVALGKTLIERGHEVVLFANEPFGAIAKARGLKFSPLATHEEYDALISDPDFWHPVKGPAKGARWGLPRLENEFAQLLRLSAGADALVASFATLAARCVQEHTGIPLATIVLQPGLIPSVADPPVLPAGPKLTAASPWILRRFHRSFVELWGNRIVVPGLNRVRRRLGLPRVRGFFRWWYSPDLTLALFPSWYGPPAADWPPQLRFAGFPRGDVECGEALSADVERFLEAGEPPVVITAGTGMQHAERLFREGLAACEGLSRRALLVTAFPEQVPGRLSSNAAQFSYVPFDALLPRCAAMVHHGGVGTTARALACGTPQLVTPFAWDQFDNAERVRRLGVGDAIPARRLSARRIARTLEPLLSESVRARCDEVSSRFEEDALELAAGWIEELAHGSRRA